MPDWREELRRRLAPLRLPPARQVEVVEELAQHLDDRFQELLVQGRPAVEARRQVLEELSERDLAEELTDVLAPAPPPPPEPGARGGDGWAARRLFDIQFALRMLRKRPGFTAVAVLTLALGIGANTAIFSTVQGVLLRPLPYPESGRLVTFWGTAPEKRLPVVNYPEAMFLFFHERTRAFESLAAYTSGGVSLSGDGEPIWVNATAVSPDFFEVMGQAALRGRGFLPEEATAGRHNVVVLGHGLWQRRFGGDSGIVGTSIVVGGEPRVVVGIMPRGFDFPERSELWHPLTLEPEDLNNWYLDTVGRLKPGQTMADAHRDVVAMSNEFMLSRPAVFPDAKGDAKAVVQPLLSSLVGDARAPLLVLLGAVGLVLLIAAANIGNLLLARGLARSREMALRCCLGASTGRLSAQLLTESLVLAVLGGAAGLMLAALGVGVIRNLTLGVVPRLENVRIDPVSLLFTLGVTLAAGLLFGVAPALRASRVDLVNGLREGSRGGTSAGARRLSHGFVVAQFALALLLLIGAGLLLRSFRRTLEVDPGFRPENVLTARVQLPWPGYGNDTVVRVFHRRLVEAAASLPGVERVGLVTRPPFSPGNPQQNLYVEDQPPRSAEAVPVINQRGVSTGYFEAIGTPLLAGRGFLASDDGRAPRVVVVDETVARHYWPGGSALGKRIRTGTDSATPWLTIVGVVKNVKHASLRERPNFGMYLPLEQSPRWTVYVIARTTGAPEPVMAGIRRVVAELDPALPVSDTELLDDAMGRSLGVLRLTNGLLAGFAALALLLAAIGIYGVMSLSVTGRLGEFGVRLALGAAPREVLALVMRQGLLLAALGLGLGLAGAVALTRLLGALLFEVSPLDPVTFVGVGVVLSGAAVAACYVPARRATRADPIAALRRD